MYEGKTWHKFKYAENAIFSGAISKEVFKMEDGLRKPHFTVLSFRINIWLRGIQHDVTDSISCNDKEILDIYKHEFLDNYLGR